jgi:cytochrome P450/ferredoxin-NADP reductase
MVITAPPALATLTYGTPAFREDSVRLLAEACAAGPVCRVLPRGVLGVLRFGDVDAILRDPRTFSSKMDLLVQPAGTERIGALLGDDPPTHTRLRTLLGQVFTPARLATTMEPRVLAIVRDVVDRVLDRGRDFDLVRDVAGPVPVRVISALLGVDPADLERFQRWSEDITGASLVASMPDGPDKDARLAAIQTSLRELDAYLADVVAHHRDHPGDDLISFMVQAAEGGERLADGEVLSLAKLLLVAGNETTTKLIGLAMNLILRNRPAWQELRASPGLVTGAIEEVLRLEGPVYNRLRRVTRDTTIAGWEVKAGSLVDCVIGAANLDASVFPDPTRFDIHRRSARHLAFGGGIHQCLGAPLARMEARIVFEELLDRMEDVAFSGEAVRGTVSAFRGFESMPLRYRPARIPPVRPEVAPVEREVTTAQALALRTDAELGLDKRTRERVRVARIRDLAEGIKMFRLVHPKGGLLTRFTAGSHIVLHLSDGVHAWRNAYSLLNAEVGNGFNYFIAVKREPGGQGGSRYLHDVVTPGMELDVSVPANNFAAAPTASRHLLVAGGIGITPLFALRHQLRARGESCALHYAFRSARQAALVDELLLESDPAVRMYDETLGQRIDVEALVRSQPEGTHVYVCGPEGLMDAVIATALAHGWARERIHFERFGAPRTNREVPFEAVCQRSGVTVACAGNETLLEALERVGIGVPYACRAGSCGACVTTVLGGDVDHRDTLLSDAERAEGKVLVCVSRGKGRVILDV